MPIAGLLHRGGHGWAEGQSQEGDGCGWPVAQGRVRRDAVEGDLSKTEHDLRLFQRVEDLLPQAIVSQLCSETPASL